MVRDSARQMLQAIPRHMAQGGAAGSFSDDEVSKFIQDTYAQFGGPGVEAHRVIADAMAQFGVGVNQVARVSGFTPREVEAEFMGQRAGEAPVLDDPTGTAAGMSAAYRAAAQAGGQQTVDDYYANLRADAEAYLANPNAPTGVDAYNLMIESGISTSDLRAAGVADDVLNKIFTVSGPIEQSQFVTPTGMTSAYERSPDLAAESQRLTALGQDGRGILDKQGLDYITNLQKDGIDAAERAQMLEYATERGYSFDDLLKAGVDPNVLFKDDGSAAAKAAADKAAADAAAKAAADAAAAAAEAERRRQADLAAAEAERNRLMDIRIAEEAERARQAAAKAAADKAAADKAAEEERIRREETLIGCPSPEMRILLSDGSLKAAGELQVGDKVRTQHEHSEQWGDHEVTRVSLIQDQPRLVLRFGDGDFVCSHSHKFYKAGKWVEASSVAAGDDLSGKTVLEVLDGTVGTVVSITVDEAHTYVCEGLLSHNKSPDTSAADAARKAAEDAAAKAAADKAAADAAQVAPGVTTGDIVKDVTPAGPTAAELKAAIDAANAKAAKEAADAKALREAQEAAEKARIAALTGAAVKAVTPSYNAQQLQDIINAAGAAAPAAGTVTNAIDTRGSAATDTQSGVSKFLETYNPASPFVAPAYTAPTVYQPLPAQPDMFAAGQPALDTTFNQSPRTAIPGMPGQFDYSPAAKLRPATGSGFSFTPPSITTRPRSLLSPREIQTYGGLTSASQRFAQNRALIDRNLRDMLNATPALRNASTYNLLRNQVMSGRFGPDPNRVFNPETNEGQQFQAYLASLAGAAPTQGVTKGTGSPIAAGGGVTVISDIDPTDRQLNAAGIGSNVVGGADPGGFGATTAKPLVYGGYGNYPLELFNKGGEVSASRRMLENLFGKKSEGSAKDELTRFQEGGIATTGRRRLNPGDDLYITEDPAINVDELLRTPEPDIEQTQSRSMLDRLKGAGRFLNQGFYENISKPAVGAAVDMTLGLGDLAQMGVRYLGDKAGMDTGEFRSVAQPVKEALGVEDYNPYTIGGTAAFVLPFAGASRGAQAIAGAPSAVSNLTSSAAGQLQSMFPNLARELAAYGGSEAAMLAAQKFAPDSTAAQLFAALAGGMGGSFAGSRVSDVGPVSRIDGGDGDGPSARSAPSRPVNEQIGIDRAKSMVEQSGYRWNDVKQITTPEEYTQFQRRYGLASAVSERDEATDVFGRGGAMFYDDVTGAPVAYATSGVSGKVPGAARQMLDEVAPPATTEQIKQVEASAPTEKSPVLSYHMDEWTQETGLSPQEIENFWRLGDNQRGLPEHLMMKAQRTLGGGVLVPAIEHIGDLTNRMTPKHSLGFAYEETLGKAQRYLRSLKNKYGFRREFEENLRNNAQFNNESLGEHRSKVNAALDAYADAHEKLVTYNPLQTLARDAAVSLGRRDFEKAETLLQDFVDRIPTREDFVAQMRVAPEPDLTKLSSRELSQKLQAIQEKRKARQGIESPTPTPAVPTETPEFKNFFGGSKVTDAGGQPLVVYHGTGSDFTAFRPSESGLLGRGIYLSSEKRVAEGFRGADKLMPIYASMKNPAYEHDLIPKKVGNKMKGDEYEKELHDRAIDGGFDGIIKGSSTDVFGNPRTPDSWGNFVVFEPTQIKSAIGNVGTFDPSTPVITKAKGGPVTSSRRMLDSLSGINPKGQHFAEGGEATAERRSLLEEQVPLDELIRRQLEGIDNTPSTARTQGSRQSESRNMLQNIAAGAMQIPGTVMDYGRGIMQSDDPLAQLGTDVKGMGGAIVEGIKQDPLGATADMLPIIGEIRSGMDAKKFSDMANEAEAAGDTALADTYRQVATLGAAGAVPFGGIGFRGARRSAMSNISDASPGSARGMLDELTPETGVVGTSNVPGVEVGQVISERFPTAVGATENPLSEILRADLLTLGRSKEQQQKIADIVSKYSNYRGGAKSPDVVINDMKEHVTDNLRFIYDQMPPEIRREASKWYEGANRKSNELAKQHGTSRESSSGVIAAMSPQKDWYQNVSLSERVMDIYHNKSDIPMDDKIYRTGLDKLKNQDQLFALDRIKDRSLNSLSDPLERAIWVRLYDETYNPRSYSIYSPSGERLSLAVNANGEPRKVAWGSFNEIAKAINVLDNPKIDNISRQMGVQHKVRNFYNNIVNPFDPLSITSDTHAVAAGLMRPLGGSATEVTHNLGGAAGSSLTGIQGTYPIFADAYRDLATERGILPRQTQSIAWEGVRGLFTPEQKRSKPLLEKIDKIMSQFNEGSMTQRQMQDAILNEAGGINLPDWAR